MALADRKRQFPDLLPALALALGALCSVVIPAGAGVVLGVLRVPPTGAASSVAANPYPGRASALAGRHDPPHGLVSDAVISVAQLPPGADSLLTADPSGHVLAQRQQAFSERVLSCVVGTVVDFPNQDPIFHNVFSVSPVKRFDLGKYPRGHSKQVRFDRTGLVQVFCDIHPSMACFILVLPNRAFARPNGEGAYALPRLPAGTYTVNVWHPDFGDLSRTVRVPASGDVTLDLAY
ncbi:MAG: carboxypeptidase regulatory-like domain-containing protein [Candidatus Eisenbacteria bacterium]